MEATRIRLEEFVLSCGGRLTQEFARITSFTATLFITPGKRKNTQRHLIEPTLSVYGAKCVAYNYS